MHRRHSRRSRSRRTLPGVGPRFDDIDDFQKLEAIHAQALQAQHFQALQDLEAQHFQALQDLEAQHAQALQDLEAQHLQALQDLEAQHLQALQDLEAQHAQALQDLEAQHAQAQHAQAIAEQSFGVFQASLTSQAMQTLQAHHSSSAGPFNEPSNAKTSTAYAYVSTNEQQYRPSSATSFMLFRGESVPYYSY